MSFRNIPQSSKTKKQGHISAEYNSAPQPQKKGMQFHSLRFHSWHSVYKNSFCPLFSLQQKRSPCWIAAQSAPTHPMRPSPPNNHSLPCIHTHIYKCTCRHTHAQTNRLSDNPHIHSPSRWHLHCLLKHQLHN